MRARQTKAQKAAVADLKPVDEGMRDEDDPFLSRVFRRGDEENDGAAAGGSLIERLKARLSTQGSFEAAEKEKQKAKKAEKQQQVARKYEDDEDDEDDDDGLDYDALVAEQRDRDEEEAARMARATVGEEDKSVSDKRRKAGKNIEKHRGLTKARPKDRKNPRSNRRLKAEKGDKLANSRAKQHKPEAEGGFEGVASMRMHVKHTNNLR